MSADPAWMATDDPVVEIDPLLAGDENEKLSRIAAMPLFQYERLREPLAKALGVRVSALDQERAKRRRPESSGLELNDPEPWPEEVSGEELLDAIARELDRYMVMPESSRDAVALWSVLTYLTDSTFILPLLCIQSPQKRCGKSTLLILLRKLCRRALLVGNLSPAALFRVVEKYSPTLLLDEADAWAKENEELRGLLNCGHTRDTAHVLRVEGEALEPRAFNVFCPKALAGIGTLPDTIEDRSGIVQLRRRRPDEQVDKLRQDRLALDHLRALALRWANDHAADIREADPDVPEELNDRAADNWRPLLAIADQAGCDWSDRARHAAKQLALVGADKDTIEVLLLGDIRDIFGGRAEPFTSADLCAALANLEDRPWSEWKHGKPMTQVQLARQLDKFEIRPGNLKLHGKVLKGYRLHQFEDAFARYLPKTAVSTATPLPRGKDKGFSDIEAATGFDEVADRSATCETTVADQTAERPGNYREGSEVADQTTESEVAGKVRCTDCAYFDPDATLCLKHERPVDPQHHRLCADFGVPF
jgi:putative DNA primase/helicase